MPSRTTLLSFAALAFAHFSSAVPMPQGAEATTSSLSTVTASLVAPTSTAASDSSLPANLSPFASKQVVIQNSLPLLSGSLSLPAPPSNLTLKFVTIGHGVQNYSCATASTNTTPTAIGALATLYDVTALALLQPDIVNLLPDTTVTLPMTNFLTPNAPLTIPNIGSFPIIGHHSFLADATPAFFLYQTGQTFFGSSLAKIAAPKAASIGPDGTGAVPWLALSAKNTSVGIDLVYRVVTAGGNPPATCAGAAGISSVPYSAAYHFYGL